VTYFIFYTILIEIAFPFLYSPPSGTPPVAAAASFAKSKLADTCDSISMPFCICNCCWLPEKKLREPVMFSEPDSCCVVDRLPVVRKEPVGSVILPDESADIPFTLRTRVPVSSGRVKFLLDVATPDILNPNGVVELNTPRLVADIDPTPNIFGRDPIELVNISVFGLAEPVKVIVERSVGIDKDLTVTLSEDELPAVVTCCKDGGVDIALDAV